MKKVLVVGGAGYVGGVIVDLLIKKKYDVTVYDNLLYEESFRKDCKFIFGDIRDTNFYRSKLNNFDCIVWLAALVGDGACSINPDLTDGINFQTLKKLIKIYKKRIIFISTCSVYGAQNGLLSEKSDVNPLSHYASSKLKCEEILQKSNSIIFRLGTLFGVSDNYSRIRMDLVVNTLSAKAFFEKKMSVFGGDQFRPILHVKDVARAIEIGIRSKKKGIYNLSLKNMRIIEIANAIGKHFKNSKIIKTKIKFQDARNYKVKNNKASKEL
ncbi:SDR family oxidoreductase, partial [Candidatus Pelagibacter sp.]|nr:SDR family oxidoreductase [Candidatus Pelagibacter sp.]